MDVHAFQRLWNRNHPEARIDEDGDWGPMTRSAMLDSPAGGFRDGPTCGLDSPEDDPPPDEDGPMCTVGAVVGACCEVDGQEGICIDTNTTSCGGEIHIGYCPGGNNVRCCTQ